MKLKVCYFVVLLAIVTNKVSYATSKPSPQEQGEEVYIPKTKNDSIKKASTEADDFKYKSYPPSKENDVQYQSNDQALSSMKQGGFLPIKPQPSQAPLKEDEVKNRLKEFDEKENYKRGLNPSQKSPNNLQEQNLNPIEIPVNVRPADIPKGMLDISIPNTNKANGIENEKEAKIESNKLVDAEEKNITVKKYHGIIWFIVVFILLLTVIFAFT